MALIKVENVSKRFTLNEYHPSLRQEATTIFKRALGRATATWEREPFWGLQDINFEVNHGECIAIIGRNGAGKTTLLRLLSRITAPTTGCIEVYGRFASMIGLGAGFDPERSGRENIVLNGIMQGVDRHKLRAHEDEIIAFAEIDRFIDLPIKRYSSGMVARLGFSIAIHLAPDILFIDEALSVGDAAFQEKCFARIFQFRQEQRTMLLVSHSTTTTLKLCQRALWLHEGHLRMDGDSASVIQAYSEMFANPVSYVQPPDTGTKT